MDRNSTNPDYYRKHPNWLVIVACLVLFVMGLCSLLGIEMFGDSRHSRKLSVQVLALAPILPILMPRFLWGFDFSPEGFTIRFLWFKVQQVPWSDISQVVRIICPIKNARRDDMVRDYLCITIKPADPLPYFYQNALRWHWWSNFFLVWNLHFMDVGDGRWRCTKCIEKYWGKIEVRKYEFQDDSL